MSTWDTDTRVVHQCPVSSEKSTSDDHSSDSEDQSNTMITGHRQTLILDKITGSPPSPLKGSCEGIFGTLRRQNSKYYRVSSSHLHLNTSSLKRISHDPDDGNLGLSLIWVSSSKVSNRTELHFSFSSLMSLGVPRNSKVNPPQHSPHSGKHKIVSRHSNERRDFSSGTKKP